MSKKIETSFTHLKRKALKAVRDDKPEAAIELYNQYLKKDQNYLDDDAHASLGGAYRRLGTKEADQKAILQYQKALDLNPESTYAVVNLVSLHAAHGNDEELEKNREIAESLLRRRLGTPEEDFWTWFDIATMELLKGETAKSLNDFRLGAEMAKCTSRNIDSPLSNLKFLYDRRADLRENIEQAQKVLLEIQELKRVEEKENINDE